MTIAIPSGMQLGSIWSAVREMAGYVAELALGYPGLTALLVAFDYVVTGSSPVVALLTIVGLILISLGGPSSRARLLSLTDAVKFSYRRLRVIVLFRNICLDAGIFRTKYSPHLGGGHQGPNHRVTPKLYRWGVRRIRRSASGLTLTVGAGRAGYGHEAFEGEAAVTMRQKLKCRDVIVDVHPSKNWLTIIRLVYGDPFAAVIDPATLPPASTPWHSVVGLDSDRLPLEKDLRLPILIAGAQGAGKSSEVWRILESLVDALTPFRTRVYDPKGGQEFNVLADKAHYYESRPTKWCVFLEKAIRAMGARQAALKAEGFRDCPVGDHRFPLDIMIIDELVTVIAMMANEKVNVDGQKVPALKAFMVFLSQCRAAGFTVIACTQLTQKEAIGIIRDLFGYVTCLRVGSAEMVRTVMGDPKLYPAHQIPADRAHAGIGFMGTDRGPVKYRAAYVTDKRRNEVAELIGVMTATLADIEAGAWDQAAAAAAAAAATEQVPAQEHDDADDVDIPEQRDGEQEPVDLSGFLADVENFGQPPTADPEDEE